MLYYIVFEPWNNTERFSELVQNAKLRFEQGEILTVIALAEDDQISFVQEFYENEELPIDWIPAQDKAIKNRLSKITHPSCIRIEAWDSSLTAERLKAFILSCLIEGSSVEMSKKVASDYKIESRLVK